MTAPEKPLPISQEKPRLLVVSSEFGRGGEPLLDALGEAGFAAVRHGPKARYEPPIPLFATRPGQFRHSIERAIRTVDPALVLPADEVAFRHLRALHARPVGDRRAASSVAGILDRSFGDAAAQARIASIGALQLFAREHGLPVPNAVAVHDEAMVRVLLESVPMPVVLKQEGAWDAPNAMFVRSAEAGVAAYRRVAGITRWWKEPCGRPVFLQQYIDGLAATRAVACRDGGIFSGVSLQPLGGSGPAQVAKIISHPTMTNVATFIVKTLNLSGLLNFDFVLEHGSRRAWLTAVKPYATPGAPWAGDAGLLAGLRVAFATGPGGSGANGERGLVRPSPPTIRHAFGRAAGVP